MNAIQYRIQEAIQADYERLVRLLEENRQSTKDILASGTRYWIAEEAGGQAIGAIGIELGDGAILMRSAAVLQSWRKRGIGGALVRCALDAARQNGFKKAYLFSRTAGKYWTRLGFHEVPVTEVVDALPEVPQVRRYVETGSIWTDEEAKQYFLERTFPLLDWQPYPQAETWRQFHLRVSTFPLTVERQFIRSRTRDLRPK